ncbi:MAG: alpha-amylase family protein [Bdellovibrionales bacterium]
MGLIFLVQVLLSSGVGFAAPSGSKTALVQAIPKVRSVTWYVTYKAGSIRSRESSAAEFVQQLPRIKAAGFNTVWISDHTTWSFMQPHPETYGPLDPAELGTLKYMLDQARAAGLKVMLPINGYGYGHWHSDNTAFQYFLKKNVGEQGATYDLCTWFKSSHGPIYTWYKYYAVKLLRELKAYHDMTYFFVYSEAGYDDTETRCEMSQPFYAGTKSKEVKSTYGNLPYQISQIDPQLMDTVVLGYHDDHAMADQWVTPSNGPINPQSRFDFVSTHGYYDGNSVYPYHGNHVYIDSLGYQEIKDRLKQRLWRLTHYVPSGTPLMLGELGISNCRIPETGRQWSVLLSIRDALKELGAGSNMWAWTPVETHSKDNCGYATGGYYLTQQPTDADTRNLTGLTQWMTLWPWAWKGF